MRLMFASLIVSLFACASLSSALAQSVQTMTFRVPVEVENIRYLSSVDVTCRIQDGTLAGTRGLLDMRLAHTIFNMVHIPIYPADHAVCTSEPRSDQAMLLCPDSLGDGLSWSNVIDVPVQDFQVEHMVAFGPEPKCSPEWAALVVCQSSEKSSTRTGVIIRLELPCDG